MGRPENPIDPQDGPVQRFAYELRKLRVEAGAPAYRSMARRVGFSAATLSQAAAGERLPTLPVLLAYVRACNGDVEEWQHRWEQTDAELTRRPRPQNDDADPPYRGLARFEPGDAELFFGRDELTAQLAEAVRRHRVSALVGASGSGKSSLLRAGLIPRLRAPDEADGQAPAAVRILTPGVHPMVHGERLEPAPGAGETWLLVDQFEELFTLCTDDEERGAFLDRLLAARDGASRLRVVLAVRADFFGRCADHRALAVALRDATLLVGPMDTHQLRAAIVRPAAARGLIVERDLTARIIEEIDGEPGSLPLMSHALMETWRHRRGRTLTTQVYEAAGGLHGAIARTAEDTYTQLPPAQAALARRTLIRLITPGDGAQDTRRPINRSELNTNDPADTTAVLEHLAAARLITLDDDTIDLAHEALITAWPRLRGWIEEDRNALRTLRQLTEAAHAWSNLDQDPGALYRGTRLAQAEEAFATPDARSNLTTLERDFLTTSTTAHDHERHAAARTTRRLRQFTGTLAVLLVLALTAGMIAWDQYRTSEQQRHTAVTAQQAAQSRALAARAVQMSDERPEAAMVLALKGYRQSPTTEARSSLLSAYGRFYANQFTGHPRTVVSTAYAADGRTLATGSTDHSVKLWDTRSHRLLATLTGHADAVRSVAFSPDGRTLATASFDHSVKLWDTRSHRLLATLTGHIKEVTHVAFSPDGRMLAISGDRTVSLWDTRTHRERAVLTGPTYGVVSLSFSPDGRMLAGADTGGTTRLWEVSSHRVLAVLAGHTDVVCGVAFSPDGRTLATAGGDRDVKLWDVNSHRLLTTLTGHTGIVGEVAFSPDGSTLASASIDGTVRLWGPRAHKALATLAVKQPVYAVAFSPDGRTLATAGKDTRLWNVASRRPVATLTGRTGAITSPRSIADRDAALTVDYDNLLVHWSTAPSRTRPAPIRPPKPVTTSVASSDGHVLATAGVDNTVRVWNLATGSRTATLTGATGTVRQLTITPDGNTLATATGNDGTIRVWDVATRRTTAVLRGARKPLSTVELLALRPDGRALAAVSADGTTRLWTMRPGQTGTPLPGPKNGAVSALAFSPDGQTLAAGIVAGAIGDSTIRVWDIATRHTTTTRSGQTGVVEGVAFSPDGRTLATASADGTVRLWNALATHVRATLTGPSHGNNKDMRTTVRFSPNGHALATLSSHFSSRNAARIWSTDADYVAKRICRLSTAHHWAQLIPDQPVKEQCPS
ncbi:nSTAND1 domain-containing NTPase [Streptomyces sp. G7(2002)]|uniref:nSTAND1 domain-containing NTPase n=1 Tax=Streptomyces sp. G7(2002) TaxID=2971798 RepID=UPI00237E4F41|nr:helix-turn-helix domain-containing protein [Streptomyces sp. G7(2002)]WDT52603.1 helix-turn-helix domain-containing protein [Streptomyces sp. G7(2002)]